jgi:hypothetical protein
MNSAQPRIIHGNRWRQHWSSGRVGRGDCVYGASIPWQGVRQMCTPEFLILVLTYFIERHVLGEIRLEVGATLECVEFG